MLKTNLFILVYLPNSDSIAKYKNVETWKNEYSI